MKRIHNKDHIGQSDDSDSSEVEFLDQAKKSKRDGRKKSCTNNAWLSDAQFKNLIEKRDAAPYCKVCKCNPLSMWLIIFIISYFFVFDEYVIFIFI